MIKAVAGKMPGSRFSLILFLFAFSYKGAIPILKEGTD